MRLQASSVSVDAGERPVEPVVAGSAWSSRIVAALALVVILWWAQAVFIPIVVGVFISYALEPFVARLGRWHVKRAIAVPLVMAAVLIALGGGLYALKEETGAFIDRIPGAVHTVARTIRGAANGAPGTVTKVRQAAQELETAAHAAGVKRGDDHVTAVRIEEPTFQWSGWLWQGGRGAVEFGAQMLAVLCLVYGMLAAGDLYKRKLVRIVPRLSDKKAAVQILDEIDRQIERFLLVRTLISAIVGVAVWIVFRLLGLEDPGVWGVICAVLCAVPIIGPTIIVVAAAIAGFVQFGSLGMAAATGGACVAIAAIEGNVLTPWLMRRVGEMNIIAVFVSLLFWGWLWGVWGLLLAVPMTAAVKAVCERVEDLNSFAELLKE
jgi:predicted PurR-regulated permease PerM